MYRTVQHYRKAYGQTGVVPVTAGAAAGVAGSATAAASAEEPRNGSNRAAGRVIAVVIPDAAPRARTLRALHAAGLAAVAVHQAGTLSLALARLRPDLVLLDVAIFPATVRDVLAELATIGAPAVILCGSRLDPATRADLLFAGADDCVLAPYLLEELVARVLAVLRRTQPGPTNRGLDALVAGPLRVDVDQHSVSIDGRRISLTQLELRLLICLLRHRGIALRRERLLADVWGYTIGAPETVTVHIRRLRSKIEVDPSRPVWIETVRGVGYRFSGEPADRSGDAKLSPGRRVPPIRLATAG